MALSSLRFTLKFTGGGLAVAGVVIGYIATVGWILIFALVILGALIEAGV